MKFGEPAIIKSNTSNIGLNIFRIVQNQLEISKISGAKEVFITINSDSEIIINFSYDIHFMESDFSTTQLLNNITTRVELLKGELIQNANAKGNSLFIRLPVLS